ncbi:MAG TPA: hypothetical protein VFE15_03620 [Marmoricola sp.]|jgi:hypothetical protein|nr:hypothetical protein [Marmoricola sp.]
MTSLRITSTLHLVLTATTCGAWGLLVWLPLTLLPAVRSGSGPAAR